MEELKAKYNEDGLVVAHWRSISNDIMWYIFGKNPKMLYGTNFFHKCFPPIADGVTKAVKILKKKNAKVLFFSDIHKDYTELDRYINSPLMASRLKTVHMSEALGWVSDCVYTPLMSI